MGICVSVMAAAQVTTSSLGGRVVDDNGEAVIGAAIVATHEPSGTVYGVITNNDGRYTIQGMRTGGPYKVEVSSLGYQTVNYTEVVLSLGELYSLNAVLKESTEMLADAIVVASATSKFAAVEKTGATTNISNEQMTSLPTVSRSITDMTRLSPYGGNGMTFSGSDGRTANFTVDGASFNNNFGLSENLPGGGNPISTDALEEIQVVISPYDVRQTNFIGGGVNAITKSGTNTFKGSAYVYHQNENMRGDTVDGEQISGARDKDRTTTYGFTLGGPIIKNKLFFFVNFEYATIPSIVNRWKASEDGVMDADNYISRTTIADMEAVSSFVKEKYGYDTGGYTDWSMPESNTKLLARIDWNINQNHHLAVRYNYTLNEGWSSPNSTSMDAGTRMSYARLSRYSMAFVNSAYSQQNLVHSFSFDLNSRLGDNLSNQFLATFSKLDDVRGTNSSEFPFIDIRGDSDTEALPYISLGYELFTWNNGVHNNVFNVKDDLTYYLGDHKIMGGVNYEYQMADNSYMRNGTGYYRYYSLDDFYNGATPEVVCLTYGYDGETNPAARVTYHKAGIYAQDEWNVNQKFKLTYGVRLDGLFFSDNDLMTNAALKALDYDGKHIDTGKWPNTSLTVSPRIGFSWDVFGNRSLKLRGGTGFFQGRLPLVFFTNMPTNSGMVQYLAQLNSSTTDMSIFQGGLVTDSEGKATAEALKTFLQQNLGLPDTITSEDGTVASGSSYCGVDSHFKMPQVWKTSIAVDYTFPTSFPFSMTAEGIYNKTINGVVLSDWSVKDVDGFSRFNGADNRPIYSDYRLTGEVNGKTTTLPHAYVLENTNKGYGYQAMLSMNMTPVNGIDLMAAYTHTVAKELTSMPGSNASSVLNYVYTVDGPTSPKLHNSENVTPDRFVASVTANDKSGNHFSLIYETWRGGYNYSYGMVNDINGDGYNYDSIYIPTDSEVDNNEFRFVSDDDKTRFMDFVHNDHYLSKHQGEYAEAYSVYSPWVHRLDFSYKHDFKVKLGNNTNTLQLSLNVKNLLNLFNSSWGVSKYSPLANSAGGIAVLKYEGVDADGYATFSTPSSISGGTTKWDYYHAIGQCWYASVGIKYMFN